MNFRLALLLFLSFSSAIALQFLPVLPLLAPWVPQWLTLVAIYWALVLDDHFSLSWICFIGLCIDVMNGSVLGLHALALLWISFLVLKNARHFRRAGRMQQILEMGLLILAYQFILWVLQGVMGQAVLQWKPYLMSSLSSAIIWPWLSLLLDDIRFSYVRLKDDR